MGRGKKVQHPSRKCGWISFAVACVSRLDVGCFFVLLFSCRSWQEFRQHFFIGEDMVVPADELPAEVALRPRGEKAPKALLRGEALPDEVKM